MGQGESTAGRREKKSLLGRYWLYFVTAVLVALVVLAIDRIGSMYFQTENDKATPRNAGDVVKFIPKHVTFELDGDIGGGGQVTYLDVDGQPHDLVLTSLPWSFTETTFLTTVSATIVARVKGDQLTCRILVDDVLRKEVSLSNPGATVTCVVLSA
ncbi:MAG: MmpS family transport accessory protein [Segniliparus sp.]|uniref:MmpS family transport accessory protein n=1 Tax=Segniliparus sp. TaxID=2804064 RepID=UPI003F2E1AF2